MSCQAVCVLPIRALSQRMESATELVRARHLAHRPNRIVVVESGGTMLLFEFAPSSLRSCLRKTLRIDRGIRVNLGDTAFRPGKPVFTRNMLVFWQTFKCTHATGLKPAETGDPRVISGKRIGSTQWHDLVFVVVWNTCLLRSSQMVLSHSQNNFRNDTPISYL